MTFTFKSVAQKEEEKIMSNEIKLPRRGTFPCREAIRGIGGTWDGETWTVTSEQLSQLRELAARSAARFNKRDTQFSRDWALIESQLSAPV